MQTTTKINQLESLAQFLKEKNYKLAN